MKRTSGQSARIRSRATACSSVPSISTEDYLERIGELIEQTGRARVVDIAQALRVSRPSVTAMVRRLADSGYVEYQKYRGLVLTDRGQAIAENIRSRHATLKRLLSLLGLDEETQERDIEGCEHCLSSATLNRLMELADFFEANPDILTAFLGRRPRV